MSSTLVFYISFPEPRPAGPVDTSPSCFQDIVQGRKYAPLVSETIGVAQLGASVVLTTLGCYIEVSNLVSSTYNQPDNIALATGLSLMSLGARNVASIPIMTAQGACSLTNRVFKQLTGKAD